MNHYNWKTKRQTGVTTIEFELKLDSFSFHSSNYFSNYNSINVVNKKINDLFFNNFFSINLKVQARNCYEI